MKKYLIIIISLTAGVWVTAQQQEIVTNSGDFHENDSCSISWTLGEVAIETLIDNNIILTQGFQQSKLTVTAIEDLQIPGIELSVYPNPTNSFLFIDVITDTPGDLYLKLFDLNGKLILLKKITGTRLTVPMQDYKPAIYILRISEDNKEIRTYQIVKQ